MTHKTMLLAAAALAFMPRAALAQAIVRATAARRAIWRPGPRPAAIPQMAGTYKVTFDFRETTPLVAGYTPFPAEPSGGHPALRRCGAQALRSGD